MRAFEVGLRLWRNDRHRRSSATAAALLRVLLKKSKKKVRAWV